MDLVYNLGLIGYPLDHSLSPAIHTATLRYLDLKGEYRLYPLPPSPRGTDELKDILELMRSADLLGLNVTIPHKLSIIDSLDALSFTAKSIGAVNTVHFWDNQLWGDNTDAAGFMADLDHLGWSFSNSDLPHALILGAGGAARAVTFALSRAGWKITIAARRHEQAQNLAHDARQFFPQQKKRDNYDLHSAVPLERQPIAEIDFHPDLIVNATPLGMHPYQDQSPWPDELPFPSSRPAVYDLVYNPPETQLIHSAGDSGLRVANGLGMLVEQAALSFKIWTGFSAPKEIMRQAVLEYKFEAS